MTMGRLQTSSEATKKTTGQSEATKSTAFSNQQQKEYKFQQEWV